MAFSKIYLLDVSSRSIELIKNYGHRRIYGPMVWAPDGNSFVFNYKDPRVSLLPSCWLESPWSLYWHDLATGKEVRISQNPWWKDPWKDIWLYSGAVWFAEDPFK